MSEDGIERDENGRFVPGGNNPYKASVITSDSARDMQAKGVASRQANGIAAAERGLLAGLPPDTVAKDVFGGWQSVVAAQTRLALDHDKGHASTRAAEFVGKAIDIMPRDRGITLTDSEGQRISAGSVEDVQALLDVVRAERAERESV